MRGWLSDFRLWEQRMAGFPLAVKVVGKSMQPDQRSGHLISLDRFASALQPLLLPESFKRVRNILLDQRGALIGHIDQKQ